MAKKKKKRYFKRKKRSKTTIYEIKAGNHFYIGKANNPYRRLEDHKKKALENIGPNTKKNMIFRQNISKLRLKIIARPRMKDWREVEIREIAKYRKKYGRWRVLNMSNGGDGASGGGHKDKSQGYQTKPSDILLSLALFFFTCWGLYLLG